MGAHRCPTCGSKFAAWSNQSIFDAARKWNDEHGKPPACRDWLAATPHHPSKTTVYERWPTWDDFLTAAGLPRLRAVWTREQVIAAIFRFRFENGRLPRGKDWLAQKDGYPSRDVVRRLFGTFNAGLVAAGYEPTLPLRTTDGYRRQAGMRQRQLVAASAGT